MALEKTLESPLDCKEIQPVHSDTDVENKLLATGVGEREGINEEIVIYTLQYIKLITNKDLLYSTGNSSQYL